MPFTRATLLSLTGCHEIMEGRWEALDSCRIGSVTCVDGLVRDGALAVPATLLEPEIPTGSAVLYAHAHGGAYTIGRQEVTKGRPALLDPPLGLWLAEQGHTVLCPDMPGFGTRQTEGTESALSKAALWHGRPLLGLMLDDLGRAFAALAAIPAVDTTRIVTTGISMGATLAYWYAALNPLVAGCAHFCAYANMKPLIETGAHDLHGPYMTVPGLLPAHDMGDVAGLLAPRLQIIGAGLRDPLTPQAALGPALEQVRQAYAGCEDRLRIIVETDGGHCESPAMRMALADPAFRYGNPQQTVTPSA